MAQIINIMIGLPGSGKSTFCKKDISEWGEGVWVSRDAVRFSILKSTDAYFAKETLVFNTFIDIANNAIANHDVVYIDATHINAASRFKLLRRLNLTGEEEICYYFFDVPIEECLRRNRGREGRERVPEHAIRNMEANSQMYITEAENAAYHPIEYRVDFNGEVE